MTVAAAPLSISVFPSALRWMAVAWRGPLLARLAFGRRTPDRAVAAVDDGLGRIVDAGSPHGVLISRLQAYADGRQDDFRDVPLALDYLTAFGRRVIRCCRDIPYGSTLTYGELADRAGSPRAARAVGNIMARNRTALIVPCHRVVGSAGSLGGYSAPDGLRMKLRLLEQEGVAPLASVHSLAIGP